MSKHTPGPWKVIPITKAIFNVESGGQCLATVDGFGREDSEANARLIAAAPELLGLVKHVPEMLKAWRKDIEQQPILETTNKEDALLALEVILLKTNALIEKAEGK